MKASFFMCIAGLSAGAVSAQSVPRNQAVEAYVQKVRVDPAEAQRRLALQSKINSLYAQLQGNPQFSSLKVVQNTQTFRVLLRFKGKKPSASEITNNPELQALLDVVESAKSRGETISLQKRVNAAANARKIETFSFTNPDTGLLEVHVSDVAKFRDALSSVGVNPDEVTLVQSDSFPQPSTTTIKGGLLLGVSTTLGGGRCTTGFAATRGADKGFLTAGHCAIYSRDGTANTSVKLTLNGVTFDHGWSRWSATTDLAFFKNNTGSLSPNVNWGGGDDPIYNAAPYLMAPGYLMCKMGSVTRYGCEYVNANDSTVTNANGVTTGPMSTLYCASCSLESPLAAKGDSGGPVYIDGVAWGIISGDDPKTGRWLWYTPSTRFSEAGVAVMYAPR